MHYYRLDEWGRVKWSIYPEESILFVKHDRHYLNILDVEKQTCILDSGIHLGDDDDSQLLIF